MASPQLPQTAPVAAEPMADDASPLSSRRPALLSSPAKKRKLSDSESTASPTSTDEVDPAGPEEGAISPKKKARAEADPSKWEGLSSSVTLVEEPKDDDANDNMQQQQQYEPIALSEPPAQLSDEELRILECFLGA